MVRKEGQLLMEAELGIHASDVAAEKAAKSNTSGRNENFIAVNVKEVMGFVTLVAFVLCGADAS